MKNKLKKKISWSFEKALLVIFVAVLVGAIFSAWVSETALRNTIAAKREVMTTDMNALIEVERIRNVAESKISDGRGYFLLGSKALFDSHKKGQQDYEAALANFEKQYTFSQVPEIIKRLTSIEKQHQEYFDQAVEFREKQTESKIVGQFFQSKTSPLRTSINGALDELARLAREDLDRAREDLIRAESKMTQGMIIFTGVAVLVVLGLMLLVIRMLYERARHQTERNRLYEEAQKAIQARDEVMVAISHDLKTPLSEISQSAESLASVTGENGASESVASIKRSVSETENLIKDILDQAKADMGNLTLRMDQREINETLAEARFMLEPLAKQRDIRLQIDMANPPVLAFFDRERVLRVLSNLVGNAVKFSPKHSKVGVRVRSDQQFVYLSVTDSGPGIPEKHRAHIFDQFWQAKKTAEQGPGLGLAIVKTIVEAHGGTVTVESQVGSGSTFTFSLPRRRPAGAVLGRPTPVIRETVRTRQQEA